MKRKKLICLGLCLFIYFISILSMEILISRDQNLSNYSINMQKDSLSVSDYQSSEGTLYISSTDGYDYIFIGVLQSGDYYSFEIETRPVNGIDTIVMFMDNENFFNYYYNKSYHIEAINYCYDDDYYYNQPVDSIGGYYLVFEDYDGIYDNYYIDFTITITTNNSNIGYNYLFRILLFTIGVISVIVILIFTAVIINIIYNKVHKTKTHSYSPSSYQSHTSYQRPIQQKIGVTYCHICGEKTTNDATFCPMCGSKL